MIRAPALHWCVARIMVEVIEVCRTVWKLRDMSRRISVLWRLASVSFIASGAISVFHSPMAWLCAVSTSCCLWRVYLCRWASVVSGCPSRVQIVGVLSLLTSYGISQRVDSSGWRRASLAEVSPLSLPLFPEWARTFLRWSFRGWFGSSVIRRSALVIWKIMSQLGCRFSLLGLYMALTGPCAYMYFGCGGLDVVL